MNYKCRSCGHKMKKAADGGCPACFSMNLQTVSAGDAAVKEKPSKTKIELFVMVLLWSLLAYGVYDQYLK